MGPNAQHPLPSPRSTAQTVVTAKARRAAAECVVGKYLSKWAHTRTAVRGEERMNRVRRKMAVFKIEKMVALVTERKRRSYQYALLVRLRCRLHPHTLYRDHVLFPCARKPPPC